MSHHPNAERLPCTMHDARLWCCCDGDSNIDLMRQREHIHLYCLPGLSAG